MKKNKKRKKTWKDYVLNIILIICIVVFAVSAVKLAMIMLEYKKGDDDYENIVESYGGVEIVTSPEPTTQPTQAQSEQNTEADSSESETTVPATTASLPYEFKYSFTGDHSALKNINSAYVGWIYLNSVVNYPVVLPEDNDYYLTHTFDFQYNASGSIFMDCTCTGLDSKNIIVYGHNRLNGKMFAQLMDYKNKSTWENCPTFTFFCADGTNRIYQIAAVEVVNTDSFVYRQAFSSNDAFKSWADQVIADSLYQTGVSISAEDKTMLLSTCTNVDNGRLVILAKLCEEY